MPETVDAFRARASAWLADNVPRQRPGTRRTDYRRVSSDEDELARIAHCRQLQRLLYDSGFAGICVPEEYGGQGLTVAHQMALTEAIEGYDYPFELQVPTFTPCMAVILEFGTEEQKRLHVPPMLRGETIWMQFLSEPSGGSDVAGALTTAVRDGDEWVLNGSKIWTTGAWWADWALCLVRTNWDVPKHRGLSVFVFEIHQPGIEIHRIEMLNGSREFCQEFITDLRVPDSQRIGDVDQGWTVGVRWMHHERTVSGGSPYVTGEPVKQRIGQGPGGGPTGLLARTRQRGADVDRRTLELIGESRANDLVGAALADHVAERISTGALSPEAGALTRLYVGTSAVRNSTIAFELTGPAAVAWEDDADGDCGIGFLMRQSACIGGGTTEMSRNVISERVLGMPRELTPDRDRPFRDVPRSGAPS